MSHFVLVTGGREYDDRASILDCLSFLKHFHGPELRVLHGAARTGADPLAHEVCEELDVKVKGYPADWSKHGRSAGPKRNQLMVDLVQSWVNLGHSCQVLAFRGGNGTRDCIRRADAAGIGISEIPEGWIL